MLIKFGEEEMVCRQRAWLSVLMAVCLFGLCSRNAPATTASSHLFLTGTVCQTELAAFRSAKAEPDVYLDYAGTNAIPNAITSYDTSQYGFSLSLASSPGFHQIFIVSPFGSAKAYADVLPGRDRHLTLSICNGLAHYDDLRSLSVELPSSGLVAYAIVQRGKTSVFVPLLTDDKAAYGFGLPDGHMTLVVGYSNNLPKCLYDLNVPDSASWQQHVRVSIDESSLAAVDLNAAQSCKPRSVNFTDSNPR